MGLDDSDTNRLGIALIIVFGLTLIGLGALTLRDLPVGAVIALTVSAVSPPALMAMERGNIDLLVWPWVILALWCMSRSRWISAVPLLATAVYLKIFPLGAVAGVFARRRNAVRTLILAAGACAVALAVEADQLERIRSTTPQGSVAAWGVAVIPTAAGLSLSPYAIGVAILAISTTTGLLWLRVFGAGSVTDAMSSVRRSVYEDDLTKLVVSAGLGLTLVTYLLGTNSDYRLIVVTILVAGLARCWTNPSCRRMVTMLVTLQFMSYPLRYPAELAGDLIWMVVMPGLLLLAYWLWMPVRLHGDQFGEATPLIVAPKS